MGRGGAPRAYLRLLRWFSLGDLAASVAAELGVRSEMSVLDLGAGPGQLAVELERSQPSVRVVGLDPDARMLQHAAQAAQRARWVSAMAQDLPFLDGSFDRIAATLLLHHLTRPQKLRALAEAARVLRPGGELVVTDWSKPRGIAKAGFLVVRVVDGFSPTADHAAGRLPELFESAGFEVADISPRRRLWLGSIVCFRLRKAARRPSVTAVQSGSYRGECVG
jgi:ubiquinone/menaquinone biosynthesis C-methylase UbiE